MNRDKYKRTEPTLGDLDRLDDPVQDTPESDDTSISVAMSGYERRGGNRGRTSARPQSRRTWLWLLLTVLVVALLALVWVNQDRLRGLFPPTRLNTMLDQADQALAAGHLEGDDNSAHALYAKALDEEPDNRHARHGLRKVGQAGLARASSAIQAHDFDRAQSELANARALLGGGTNVKKVARQLQRAQHPPAQLGGTINKAQAALASGHVAGKKGAAALYHQALVTDPDNQVAEHGLNRAGDALADQARAALGKGDIATASSLVSQLNQLLPHNGGLPALRAEISQARQADAATIKQHLSQGQDSLHAGKFTGSGSDNAKAQFQAVLTLDPDNSKAIAGLQQVARSLIVRANAAMDDHAVTQAGSLLAQAVKLDPKSSDLALAQSRLASMQAAASGPGKQGRTVDLTGAAGSSMTHPDLAPLQKVEIDHLVRRAHSAAKSGHIMLPPGQSAYDLYREALTIDGNNAAALAGLQALSLTTADLFDKALVAHNPKRADGYLQTLRSLDPANDEADAMTRRLAEAWLDRAEHSLDANNRTAAGEALEAARKLAPNNARVKTLTQRLKGG